MSDTNDVAVSLPFHAAAAAVLRDAKQGLRHRRSASRKSPVQDVCNSTQNAGLSVTCTHLVTVTHPFHPLSGQSFVCIGERYNRYGKRLLLQVDEKTVRSVPPQWTDLFTPDPESVMGEKPGYFRLADLVELARLVARLCRRDSMEIIDGM